MATSKAKKPRAPKMPKFRLTTDATSWVLQEWLPPTPKALAKDQAATGDWTAKAYYRSLESAFEHSWHHILLSVAKRRRSTIPLTYQDGAQSAVRDLQALLETAQEIALALRGPQGKELQHV
jgi:hypothetical protein